MSCREKRTITVALAGNPNVGKSTLFNALTGLHQHTGNWPGKTVGSAVGTLRKNGIRYEFADLPGTYSLNGKTEDERIAAEYLSSGKADCTLVVCDGSCLERNLILALQVLQRCRRVVLCVNLMDEAKKLGYRVDGEKLSAILNVPVILTWATDRAGREKLLHLLEQTALGPEQLHAAPEATAIHAQEIASRCVSIQPGRALLRQRRLDRFLVTRRWGIPVMLLLLFVVIWLTVWGANYPGQLLEAIFDRGYVLISGWINNWPSWLSGILMDGIYGTVSRVISVMLPPMLIFFPLFTLLEDVGYLPRMAFLLDRGMSRCGGCGKQALTLCMGLGCNAVGVTGCRIIDSPRERLLAILTNAMVPCNGRFPTLILLGSLFFPQLGAAAAVAFAVVLGVLGAMVTSGVLSKTALRQESSVFIMEMPPFRKPRIGQILVRSLLDRTLQILLRALKVAAPAGALLWLMGSGGLLAPTALLLDPLGQFLGMSGVNLLVLILAIPANELLIPVIFMMLTGGTDLRGSVDPAILAMHWTWRTAVCMMVFTLFHWPCAATLQTIRKETGSWKLTAGAFMLPTAVGMGLCGLLNILFQNIGG